MTLSLPNKCPQFRQLDRLHPYLDRLSIWSAIAGTGLAALSQQILYACVPLSIYIALLSRDRQLLQRACQIQQTHDRSIAHLQATNAALEKRLAAVESGKSHEMYQPDLLSPVKTKVQYLQRKYRTLEIGTFPAIDRQIQNLQAQCADLQEQILQKSLEPPKTQIQRLSKISPTKTPHRPKRDRVAIFVDGANLYHSARDRGITLDYGKLRSLLQGISRQCRACFYTGSDRNDPQQQNFLAWLATHGYQITSKDLLKRRDGSVKADLDLELALDMQDLAETYDTAVLASGDGDFAPIVRRLRDRGKRVEIASFRGNTSHLLLDLGDSFFDLALHLDDLQKSA
ncbi:MAG: NYN domain-containing protein [Cyanobacteria bacterium P01_E01_bin.42]